MTDIHVIHENSVWVEPLAEAFAAQGLSWVNWHLAEGEFDLSAPPPEGIFYNRMSASSHTRDHRYSAEYTAALLAWLQRHGRKVVNGAPALDLEISKARQYATLDAAGIRTPRTVAVLGKERLPAAARRHFGDGPFILKPNRGGKGLGVQLFQTVGALEAYLESDAYEASADGIHLLQHYVRAPVPYIVRAEFIGRRFLYAVRVDTSDGFELCPADACQVGDAFCPAGEAAASPPAQQPPKFQIIHGIASAQQAAYERFLEAAGIDVAGIEYVLDAEGVAFTYDVNTNTNYNPDAERVAGKYGMKALAAYLGVELRRLYPEADAA
ncbi:ATP-grasp domain-containing protein [Oceanibaculum pacificum]|uniref:Alpha-L-glutamate ligase n=1 Tax=Oceanibaculum pacificum TaxID=580166 RepID=A0A154W1L1_9PROT|nr:alpha-L-glutamate ligase [Oceanibaculum pacificum]KZD07396.1 alpha-L-glutamate ligase [Oceanibaculum pacificum]